MPSESIEQSGVESLRHEVESAIGETVDRLRRIEASTQQQLRHATREREHLQTFLDELHYRLHFLTASGEPPATITGPLSEDQLNSLQGQEESLRERKALLERENIGLEQLETRLTWLIHQIEGACGWVLSSQEPDSDVDAAKGTQPSADEQVMWAQIIMGQETERARLAREIHDGPAQVLANTVMRLQFVEQMFRHRPDEVQSELARVRSTLQESLKDVRRFIFNLRPASLTDVGLLPTLRQYTQDYVEQFGVPVELNLPETLTLSGNQELVVFRIIQEALQNIHKHAEATKIDVNIQQRPGGPMVVSISDNGRGFDPRSARRMRPSSSGLVSMKERAATVGGTLKIDSRPEAGTTITLVLPVSKVS
ncbi:MAG TPA: sensor histidine kinase [Chloroflexia bacterium]|jgi:two-component system sensor histidine kinase DegS